MSNETNTTTKGLSTASYVIAVICLGLGICIGYLIRGGSPQQPATAAAATQVSPASRYGRDAAATHSRTDEANG